MAELETSILPLVRSYWNSAFLKREIFSSELQPNYVLVEGLFDAEILSRIKCRKSDIRFIPVSNMYLDSATNRYLIGDSNKIKKRGKSFITKHTRKNGMLSDCFGLVDMDGDITQTQINNSEGRVIDSSKSITIFGKIVENIPQFLERFYHLLVTNKVITLAQKKSLDSCIPEMALWTKVLGVQRVNYNLLKKTDIKKIHLSKSINLVLEENQKISKHVRMGIKYYNDHDVVDLISSLISQEFGFRIGKIKSLFDKLSIEFAENSSSKIEISNAKKIHWV